MLNFESPSAMHLWNTEQHRDGRLVGLVPTMGALHRGHVALIHEARRRSDRVVVSIFVNPLQFNRRNDFDRYPRPMSDDVELCRSEGVDVIYAPTVAAMYPAGFDTHVEPGDLAQGLEGAGRPGHFRGVATVVTKLFNAVRPDVAVFGNKDFQQLAVIRQMVDDLDMGIETVGVDTIREANGLALSSRNRRLNDAQRSAAVAVPLALAAVQEAFERGTARTDELCEVATRTIANEPEARLEYVDIVDPATLQSMETAVPFARIVIAVWFGDIRLIDNVALAVG